MLVTICERSEGGKKGEKYTSSRLARDLAGFESLLHRLGGLRLKNASKSKGRVQEPFGCDFVDVDGRCCDLVVVQQGGMLMPLAGPGQIDGDFRKTADE